MKTVGLIELPSWLIRILSDAQSGKKQKRRGSPCKVEPCEQRVLLSTYYIPNIRSPIEGDYYTVGYSNQEGVEFNVGGGEFAGIPQNDQSGNQYDQIQVDGSAGHETLTVDFRNGAFSQSPANPTIQFTGTEPILGNTLVIEGNPGSNVTLTPSWQLIFTDPHGRSTTVEYGAGVSHVDIDLPEPASSLILLSIGALLALRRRDHETDPSIAGV